MKMTLSIDMAHCWSDRIAGLFDQAIERLWFAEGKEMQRTVLEQAHELALEQLGFREEYRQWDEKRQKIEQLKAELVELEQRIRNVAESHVGVLEHHSRDIDSVVIAAFLRESENGLARVSLRGLGQPTGGLVAPQVNGWTKEVHKRHPFDPAAAQKLLAEAGYKDGFEVNFSCPNNRYINDEQICQAVTAMWAKIGIKAKLRTEPLTTYFPMIQRYEASIYMLGWGVPTFDAFYSLQSLVRTVGDGGDGNYNVGRYSNPQMDALIERTRKETDLNLRTELLTKALQLQNDDVAHIPLHNQIIPWAMKKGVDTIHRADNRIDWRQLKVK